MMKNNNPKIQTLIELGPKYIAPGLKWPDYIDLFQFDDSDIDGLVELLLTESLRDPDKHWGDDPSVWVPIHIWRVLGQLKNSAAIAPLMQCIELFVDDDYASEELCLVFALIGEMAIEPLENYLYQPVKDENSHSLAVESLAEIATLHGETEEHVLRIFKRYMASPHQEAYRLHGYLISYLINLEAADLIDEIRRLFKKENVDWNICGDLEDVEIELGLRFKRSTPKPRYNSFLDCLGDSEQDEEVLDELKALMQMETIEETSSSGVPFIREQTNVGRNDPCPCGSGKKCCGI